MYNFNSKPKFKSDESDSLFVNLNESDKQKIFMLRQTAQQIIINDQFKIINESLGFIKENFESWYSYAIILDSPPDITFIFNKQFIDHCIENGLFELLTDSITFRFETGETNAINSTKSLTNCE